MTSRTRPFPALHLTSLRCQSTLLSNRTLQGTELHVVWASTTACGCECPSPSHSFLTGKDGAPTAKDVLWKEGSSLFSPQFSSMQGGWDERSWERKLPGSVSSPSFPSLPGTQREGLHLCVLLGEMGCPASGAEDDSLGSEPGTLGKARPASGQSPRELEGGRRAASAVDLSWGLSKSHHDRSHLPHLP